MAEEPNYMKSKYYISALDNVPHYEELKEGAPQSIIAEFLNVMSMGGMREAYDEKGRLFPQAFGCVDREALNKMFEERYSALEIEEDEDDDE